MEQFRDSVTKGMIVWTEKERKKRLIEIETQGSKIILADIEVDRRKKMSVEIMQQLNSQSEKLTMAKKKKKRKKKIYFFLNKNFFNSTLGNLKKKKTALDHKKRE